MSDTEQTPEVEPVEAPKKPTKGKSPKAELPKEKPKAKDPEPEAPETKDAEPEAPSGAVTEKACFVTYIGKQSAVSHNGSGGLAYFFNRHTPVQIVAVDQANYERKAERNPNNWEIRYRDVPVFEEVHMIKFNGSKTYPDEIDLFFDNPETGEKDRKFVFKVGEWADVSDPAIAKTLSDKALSNVAWSYQLDKRIKVIA